MLMPNVSALLFALDICQLVLDRVKFLSETILVSYQSIDVITDDNRAALFRSTEVFGGLESMGLTTFSQR